MKVQQRAGNCHLEVYLEGSPLWPTLTLTKLNGERVEARLSMEDLHDLRYCVERVLTMVSQL